MSTTPALASRRIDWRTVFMALPKRRYSAEELQRATPAPMSAGLRLSIALNLVLPLLALLVYFGRDAPAQFSLVMAGFIAALAAAGAAAWRNPSGRVAHIAYWLLPLVAVAAAWPMARDSAVPRPAMVALAMELVIGTLGLWFAIVHRHQYVGMRLAELAERERAVEMARRLAAAQLEPHFLFNTLASLQHWVQTGDARAAPLLQALTGYLRATLPMFARATLPAGDEIEAVRRFLQVMQARLGERLAWRIEVEPRLLTLALPPGLLLTLVENAIEHGIEPQVGGGEIVLAGRLDHGEAVFEVRDSGPGPQPGHTDGIGLANSRERLALLHGAAARLNVVSLPGGGGLAELRLPAPFLTLTP